MGFRSMFLHFLALTVCVAVTCFANALPATNLTLPEELKNLKTEEAISDQQDVNIKGAPMSSSRSTTAYPKDCSEIPKGSTSGLHIIYPQGTASNYFVVYCDMSSDGGGWTVIQRNRYGSANIWDQTWQMYKNGFGSVAAEHWLGNENIYQLTSQKMYKARFVIYDASNNLRFANYDYFAVDSESLGYALRLGRYSGTAGDALMVHSNSGMHDNMKFTTKDKDQDFNSSNCAVSNGAGWWYNNCRYGQLNSYNSIYWYGFCNGNCKGSEILIKPVDA